MRYPSPLALFAALVMAACGAPTAVTSDGVLTVRPRDPALQIENRSPTPVNHFIVERAYAARILWMPCAGPTCPVIPAEGLVEIPYSSIAGYSSGAHEAIVYWWRSVPDGAGGFRPDSIRGLVTPL